MKQFLLNKGFQEETLALLNDENLARLAKDYGWNE